MKPQLQIFVTVPTALVAVYCLIGDAGLVSFLKKVGATYVFFSILAWALGALWDAAAPARRPAETGPPQQESSEGAGPGAEEGVQETDKKPVREAAVGG